MAIFISKNALLQNPLNEKVINVNDQKEKALKSDVLNLPYLQMIASNDSKNKPISVNNARDFSEEIIRVKIALNIIDDYIDIPGQTFDIPGGFLVTDNVNSGNFDTHFINAINEFQNFTGLTVTTEIDSKTLSKIDLLLDSKVIINRISKKIIGKESEKSINFVSVSDENGNYNFEININGRSYNYTTNQAFSVNPINASHTNTDADNKIFIGLQENELFFEDLAIQNNLSDFERSELKKNNYATLDSGNLFYSGQFNIPVNKNTLQDELNLAPPRILPDKHARLHLVKPGDQLDQLIINEYYNNQSLSLLDKYTETNDVIYTFPARTLNTDPATRKDDARYQFYLNLIYYYNTPEGGENSEYNEYGIKKSSNYIRYQDDHLNAFNMFDNEFSQSNPESVLPNYYRFLKTQEQNGTSIEFDTLGKPISFQLDSGKYIWIPSREFSEGLYYHMNFRHNEMLLSDVSNYIGQTQENQLILDMENPSIWDFILEEITDLVDYLKGEVLELFQETLDYFRKMYAWIIDTLAKNMYRGLGGQFSLGVGVTWGYPVATDIDTSKTLWRKMSQLDELILVFREDFEAFVGLDAGIGGSIGFKIGNGNKKKSSNMKAGVGLAAGVQAGVRPNMSFEYEFPIRPEETGLIVMCISVFGGVITKLGASLLSTLNIINLDPTQYLTWSRMGIAAEASAWGVAQLGFDSNGNPKEKTNVTKPVDNNQLVPKQNDKSFLSVENIWDNLPGIGLQANGRAALGIEIEYRAEYDDNPLVPEINGRIPSKVEIENMFYFEGQSMAGGVGDFIQKILLTTTGINGFLSLFNIEIGFGIGSAHTFKRTTSAREIQESDINISNAITNGTPISNPNNGSLRIEGTNGTWESQLFLSKYSGDVDGLFMGGSDVKLKFDLHKLRQAVEGSEGFFSFNSIDNVVGLFYSIEFHYLPNFLIDTKRKVLANSFFEKINSIQNENNTKRELLQTAKKYSFQFYAGGNIKMELKLQKFNTAFKYFVRRWYLMIIKNISQDPDDIIQWKQIKNKIDEKERKFRVNNYSEEGVFNRIYYEDLYAQLGDFLKTEYDVEDTMNYRNVVIQCLLLPGRLLKILLVDYALDTVKVVDTTFEFVEDLRLLDFVKALTTLADFVDTSAGIEAKIGYNIAAAASASFGAKVKLAFSLGGAIIYRNLFLENNVPVVLPSSDNMSAFIRELNQVTNISPDNQNPEGIRQALHNVPK